MPAAPREIVVDGLGTGGLNFDAGVRRESIGLADLRDIAASSGEPTLESGKQELFENLINDHIVRGC